MLTIRFNRIGRKNKAYFRIVLQEHTVAPGGRHIEVLGSWDPHQKRGVFQAERIQEWLKKGAQVSDSVWNLLIRQGIIKGKKRPIKIAKASEKADKTKKEKPDTEAGPDSEKEKIKEVKMEEKKSENQ